LGAGRRVVRAGDSSLLADLVSSLIAFDAFAIDAFQTMPAHGGQKTEL
jgi:hypothetical protein